MKKIIIISLTSDIGKQVANYYSEKKFKILGTYRNENLIKEFNKNKNVLLYKLDLTSKTSIKKFCKNINKNFSDWDYIIFCNGDLSPVAKFKDANFDLWENSIMTNSISSLRILNYLLKIKKSKERKVLFFAGGGTNNATKYYSSYTLSKIFLIKFVELLDFEENNIKTCILGPGWVNTKIHSPTIKSKIKDFKNKKITQNILKRDDTKKMLKLLDCIDWIFKNMNSVSGRNISLDYDQWGSKNFIRKLKKNKNIYKLRRYGN